MERNLIKEAKFEAILDFVKANPGASRKEIVTCSPLFSIDIVISLTKELIELGKLRVDMADKKAAYYIQDITINQEETKTVTSKKDKRDSYVQWGKLRNKDTYTIDDSEPLSKGQTARAIVEKYVKTYPEKNFKDLKEVFKDNLIGNPNLGVFKELKDCELKPLRYFVKPQHRIKLKSGIIICVTNQIDYNNLPPLLAIAKECNFNIVKV